MKRSLLQRLTGPVTVLRIRFTDTANYSMSLFVLDCTGEQIRVLHREDEPDAAVLKRECAARPVLVSVAGHGIITKPADGSPLVEKVKADPETFAWSFSNDDLPSGPDVQTRSITFVRRGQVEPLLLQLAESGIPTAGMRYDTPGEEPEPEASREALYFYRARLKWRTAVRPTPWGNMLCKALARRLRLPVLGLMLLLLVVNALASASLEDRRAEQRTVLAAREKTRGVSQARSEQRRAAVTEFSQRLAYRHAWLLDRTASHVPREITLTSLAVQPLVKRLEDAKDPVFASETLSVRGRTDDAAAVSRLIAGLKSDPPFRKAKLEQLEQNRESGSTEFKITIAV